MKNAKPTNTSEIDYVLVGGGSGGHITPLLAVANSLKDLDPNCKIAVIGQKGENLKEALDVGSVDAVFYISAGKFRRYHGESFISHLLDFKTIALNFRDLFRFIRGIFQARRLLKKIRPRAIFLKGGFVSVPVGFAASRLSISYVTHDSDAIPGLANRLTAKRATFNTTALPSENYPYPNEKVRVVGIPLRPEFTLVAEEQKKLFKKELNIDPNSPVIFCTGGGNGSQTLNELLIDVSLDVFKEFPNITILHLTGKKLVEDSKQRYIDILGKEKLQNVRLFGFYSDLYKLSGAADVVISRAGATNLAEFALQGKASIVVPSPFLTGGQQLHNAKILEENKACVIVEEGDKTAFKEALLELLRSPDVSKKLANNFHKLAVDDAAVKISKILQEISNKSQ